MAFRKNNGKSDEAARKAKEAEKASLKSKEAARKAEEAEKASIRAKEAEEAARKAKEAEEASLKSKEAEEAARKAEEADRPVPNVNPHLLIIVFGDGTFIVNKNTRKMFPLIGEHASGIASGCAIETEAAPSHSPWVWAYERKFVIHHREPGPDDL